MRKGKLEMPNKRRPAWTTRWPLAACAIVGISSFGHSVASECQPQPGLVDDEPPVIEHAPSSVPGDAGSLTLSATVTDNTAVCEVILLYKTTADSAFKEIAMPRMAGNMFRATIQDKGVQRYYFRATDVAGNASARGGPRDADPFTVVQPSASVTPNTATSAPETKANSSSRTWMWWTLGLVASGAAAYFATQSDSPAPSGDRGTVVK